MSSYIWYILPIAYYNAYIKNNALSINTYIYIFYSFLKLQIFRICILTSCSVFLWNFLSVWTSWSLLLYLLWCFLGSFPSVDYFTQFLCVSCCFILFYYCPWETVCSLIRDRNGADWLKEDGEGTGKNRRRGKCIRIYYVKIYVQ